MSRLHHPVYLALAAMSLFAFGAAGTCACSQAGGAPQSPSPTAVAAPAPPPKLPVVSGSGYREVQTTASDQQRKPITAAPASTRPVSLQRLPVELPRRFSAPTIGVNTEVEFVGLLPDGSMDVPKDPATVAWYKLGPRPGETGNAILAGHVDWGGKVAVFWGLRNLKPGDEVEVTATDERKYVFKIQWLKWYDADEGLANAVFEQSNRGELTLITCGGVFDASTHQYLSRLVVRGAID